jgi:hypothetical protein
VNMVGSRSGRLVTIIDTSREVGPSRKSRGFWDLKAMISQRMGHLYYPLGIFIPSRLGARVKWRPRWSMSRRMARVRVMAQRVQMIVKVSKQQWDFKDMSRPSG